MEQTTRRNLLAKRPNQLVLAGVLSFLLTLVATAASDDNDPVPSRPNWIRAGTSSSDNWSREALLSQILGSSKVETREQVSALLGPPNYTVEEYSAGPGIAYRFDTYRLSAKNDRSYHVTYRSSGEILNQGIENSPCGCPICEKAGKAANASLPSRKVSDFLATLKDAPAARQMLSAIESGVGSPGVKKIDSVHTGGRLWANYSVTWSISDADHRFFMATGSKPITDYAPGEDLPIEAYWLITVMKECLGN